MAEPFNYMIQTPDIGNRFMGGFEQGFALNQLQRKAQEEERARQAAEMQAAENQRIQREYYQKVRDRTVTMADTMMMQQTLNPDLLKSMQPTFEQQTKDEQSRTLGLYGQIAAALANGDGAVAEQLAMGEAESLRNGGDEQRAKSWEVVAKTAKTNPAFGETIAYPLISSIPGGKEVVEKILAARAARIEESKTKAETGKIQAETKAIQEKTPWDIANVQSQINERSGRLGLDRDKLQTDVEMKLQELGAKQTSLSESAQKIVNESAVNGVAAQQSAARANDLAGRLEAMGGGYGAAAGMAEWLARATGSQDALSQARTEYTLLRNKLAANMLPPGAASDKDIQLVMSGFPPETADAKYLAKFLRAQANVQAAEAAFEETKAQWVNEVGYLGKPKRDVVIDGVQVPAGTTLASYWAKNGKGLAKKQNAAAAMSRYSKYVTEGQ